MELAQNFVKWDPNEETRKVIEDLISKGDIDTLNKLLGSRMAFGTAGLRGPMGAGFNHMNDLVILQTSQGLAKYIEKVQGDEAKAKGIVVGYDHRKLGTLSSKGFAHITAAVFISRGFKVYLLEGQVPTPFVAFGVKHFGAAAGIMVTASHNPKQDNGYKVYWNNGSQIIPPHDAGIAACILENLEPWHSHYEVESVFQFPLAVDATEEVAQAYYSSVQRLFGGNATLNQNNSVKVTYTAMHGVGTKWILRALPYFSHREVHLVSSQCDPDPEFPTVSFPNPEEKGALNRAMEEADRVGSTFIIANDPDADRLAIAEKVGNSWKAFTGNEIGIILGHWMMTHWRGKNVGGVSEVNGQEAAPSAVLASVVSSRMLKAMAKAEGVQYFDTLTGFKWLGNRSSELRAHGIPVLFSYEEALGYCLGDVVADKDGVCAASVCLEMVATLATQGMTVNDYLQSLFARYGQFVSYNSYVFCHDPRLTDQIFSRIRHDPTTQEQNNDGHISYWKSCAGVAIQAIKDVTLGYDSQAADLRSDLPVTPDSHMIMFEFANGCSVTLRTSGTEPKIKFYTEMAGKPGQSREEVQTLLHDFVEQVVSEMLEPAKHGLKRP